MELTPKNQSVRYGHLVDPGRFRKILGKQVFESLRYFETAAEVESNADDDTVLWKAHRFVIITEELLFVLKASRRELSRDIWKGEGAHEPIKLENILSITPLPKRSEIFLTEAINEVVQHFKVLYFFVNANGDQEKRLLELAAWESGSLLVNQLQTAWINLQIRRCIDVAVQVDLGAETSQSLICDLYNEVCQDILHSRSHKARLESLNELAEAALQDRLLKTLFFANSTLLQHLLAELLKNHLPRSGRSRLQQLEFVAAIYRLIHSMIFNSQMIAERSNLLSPAPLHFQDFLEICTLQFDVKAMKRAQFKKEEERKKLKRTLKHQSLAKKKPIYHWDDEKSDSSEDDDYYDGSEAESSDDDLAEVIEPGSPDTESKGSYEEIIQAINDCQVGILLELDDFISLAVKQGRSRSIVSETLANHLAKINVEHIAYALGKYVKRSVELVKTWKKLKDTGLKTVDFGGIVVRIYQHTKLFQRLIFGSWRALELLLETSEEELRYYLFKTEFNGVLEWAPIDFPNVVQVNILNKLSLTYLQELRSAAEDLAIQKEREKKERSILLV